jgi:hypothetical protein
LIDLNLNVGPGLADFENVLIGDDLTLQTRRLLDRGRVQSSDPLRALILNAPSAPVVPAATLPWLL